LIRYAKENVLKFLVGNKSDLDGKRVVSLEQGKELAKQYNIPFFETSARDSTNIDSLFTNSTKTFVENQKSLGGIRKEKSISKPGVNLGNEDKKKNETKKFKCC